MKTLQWLRDNNSIKSTFYIFGTIFGSLVFYIVFSRLLFVLFLLTIVLSVILLPTIFQLKTRSGLSIFFNCTRQYFFLKFKHFTWISYATFFEGGYGASHHFQQYFTYILAVSFIGGGNRSTRRTPQTCHKSLTNFTT